MNANITVKQTMSDLSGIRAALAALTEQDVLIGIPEDKTARKEAGDTGISNAHLGYIHEFGVPEKNIPARPHLLPGIRDVVPEAVKVLQDAAEKALEGNSGAVAAGLNKIGILGQNAVRTKFVDNDWPALAERTLDYQPLHKSDTGAVITDKNGTPRRKKSRRERERVNPLINTGQLRKAYTYVIRQRGAADSKGMVVR